MQSEVGRVARFLSVGLFNTFVTYLLIVGTKWLLGWTDLSANALGYVAGVCVGFVLNRSWTFDGTYDRTTERAMRYVATFFLAYLVNVFVLALGLNVLRINGYIAQLITMPFYSLVFYLLCRTWVFRKPIGSDNSGKLAMATGAVIALLCVPIAQTVVPPMADYPNHLARTYIANHVEQDATLQAFYVFEWRLITNMMWDAMMAVLVPLSGDLYLAGRVLLASYMAVLVTGAMALHRAWSGRWSPVPLLVSLFAYNGTFVAGFVVFGIGTGLALWAAAGWHLLTGRAPLIRLVYGLLVCTGLYLVHLFALGLFGLLAGVAALREVWLHRSGNPSAQLPTARAAWLHLCVTLTAALPALALHVSNPSPGAETGALEMSRFDDLYWVAYAPFAPAAIFYVGIGVGVLYVAARERRHLHPDAGIAMFLLLCIWAVCPRSIYETYYVSARFLLLFAILLPVAWRPERTHAIKVPGLYWPLMVLVLVNVCQHAIHWRNYGDVVDDFYRLAEHLPEGALLEHAWNLPEGGAATVGEPLPSSADVPVINPMRSSLVPQAHLTALATIERQAFIPTHFTHPPKHLLRVTDAYAQLDREQSGPLFYPALREQLGEGQSIFEHPSLGAYDYLLVSPAPNMSTSDAAFHAGDIVHMGPWLWLLKRPTP